MSFCTNHRIHVDHYGRHSYLLWFNAYCNKRLNVNSVEKSCFSSGSVNCSSHITQSNNIECYFKSGPEFSDNSRENTYKRCFFSKKWLINLLHRSEQAMFPHDINGYSWMKCLFILINQLYKCTWSKNSKSDYSEYKLNPMQ